MILITTPLLIGVVNMHHMLIACRFVPKYTFHINFDGSFTNIGHFDQSGIHFELFNRKCC